MLQRKENANMSDRDDFGVFLLGFVIGGLAGAVTALILAPQSGEETRTVIREKAIELRDKAEKTADEAMTKANEVAAQTKSKAEEVYSTTKQRADEVLSTTKHRADEVISSTKSKAGTVISEAKHRVSEFRRGQVTLDESTGSTPADPPVVGEEPAA
jgi:gas vesicle protein